MGHGGGGDVHLQQSFPFASHQCGAVLCPGLQVMPFHPHKEASALQLGPSHCPPSSLPPSLFSPPPSWCDIHDNLFIHPPPRPPACVQVMPFHPHKEASALQLGPSLCPPASHTQAGDSEGELRRVAATLRELRSITYLTLDKVRSRGGD